MFNGGGAQTHTVEKVDTLVIFFFSLCNTNNKNNNKGKTLVEFIFIHNRFGVSEPFHGMR